MAQPKLTYPTEVWHNMVSSPSAPCPFTSPALFPSPLSRIHGQTFEGSIVPSASESLTAGRAASNVAQLDMNVSCLFMHEVTRRGVAEMRSCRCICFSYGINISSVNMKIWSKPAPVKKTQRHVEGLRGVIRLFSLVICFLGSSL